MSLGTTKNATKFELQAKEHWEFGLFKSLIRTYGPGLRIYGFNLVKPVSSYMSLVTFFSVLSRTTPNFEKDQNQRRSYSQECTRFSHKLGENLVISEQSVMVLCFYVPHDLDSTRKGQISAGSTPPSASVSSFPKLSTQAK